MPKVSICDNVVNVLIDLWCNGNTADFGSVIRGSSPRRSTNFETNVNNINIITMSETSISLFTIMGCILIILKACNLTNLSWFYVLLPIIIPIASALIGLVIYGIGILIFYIITEIKYALDKRK